MRLRNWSLMAGVVVLAVCPLILVHRPAPGPDGQEAEIFTGSDDQASAAIETIDPGYKRWATPLFEPASSEIESLLFALQAALGAAVIGYWLGVSVTREKYRQGNTDTGSQQDASRDN